MKNIILLFVVMTLTLSQSFAQKNATNTLPLIFSDDFHDNSNQWIEASRDSVLKIVGNGKLTIENFSNDYPWSIKYVNLDVNKDFIVSVNVRHEAGYVNTGYGIAMIKDSGNFYLSFKISSDGYYVIGATAGDSGWTAIQDWKQSPHINKGNDILNKLTIKHIGNEYEFYINDALIEKRESINIGGQFVGLMSSGRQRVSFDDFELRGYKAGDSQ